MKIIFVVFALIPSFVFSETFEYGWLPTVSSYETSLDVESEAVTAGNVVSGVVIINTGRGSRLWNQLQYHSLEFEGNEVQIGQEVSGFDIAAIYQTQFRISRRFKPWFGIGTSFSTLEYKNRFTTDNQGFLAQRYDDVSKAGVGIDLNFTADTDWFDKHDSGFAVRISIPVNDLLTKAEAGFYVIF